MATSDLSHYAPSIKLSKLQQQLLQVLQTYNSSLNMHQTQKAELKALTGDTDVVLIRINWEKDVRPATEKIELLQSSIQKTEALKLLLSSELRLMQQKVEVELKEGEVAIAQEEERQFIEELRMLEEEADKIAKAKLDLEMKKTKLDQEKQEIERKEEVIRNKKRKFVQVKEEPVDEFAPKKLHELPPHRQTEEKVVDLPGPIVDNVTSNGQEPAKKKRKHKHKKEVKAQVLRYWPGQRGQDLVTYLNSQPKFRSSTPWENLAYIASKIPDTRTAIDLLNRIIVFRVGTLQEGVRGLMPCDLSQAKEWCEDKNRKPMDSFSVAQIPELKLRYGKFGLLEDSSTRRSGNRWFKYHDESGEAPPLDEWI